MTRMTAWDCILLEGSLLFVERVLYLLVVPIPPPDAANDTGSRARDDAEHDTEQGGEQRAVHKATPA